MEKIKVVCVGYSEGAGGAERQMIMLANELSKRNYAVTIIALAKCNIKYDIQDSIELINLANENGDGILARNKKFRKTIKEISPNYIINYWFQSAFFSVYLPKKYRGKIIYSERGDPGDSEYSGFMGIVRKNVFKKLDGIVFQSKGAQNFFDKKIKEKSVIIPNSVNVPNYNDEMLFEREKKIVCVGRLHAQKNQKLLINAFAQLIKDCPQYTLEIYGDGELHDSLENQIIELGLEKSVFLRASCKDLFDKIRKASLFVLSSDYEGMPNALMEAMALGLPCVSTDCRPGGAKELINNGENGILVPIDDVNKLSQSMKLILQDQNLSKKLAENAKQIKFTNSNERIFDKWDHYIKSIIIR